MFDARLRPLIDPPLDRAGRRLAAAGISADTVTITGFGFGLAAAVAIATGLYTLGALLIAVNRICDGLDGAVARASGGSDRGAFLDISLDFAFYGLIPLAFALADPATNALPAAVLVTAFYVNGAAFLAFAALAARRGLTTQAQGRKGLYYMAGLAEGGETVAALLAAALMPQHFPVIALGFAALTALSATARIIAGARAL